MACTCVLLGIGSNVEELIPSPLRWKKENLRLDIWLRSMPDMLMSRMSL